MRLGTWKTAAAAVALAAAAAVGAGAPGAQARGDLVVKRFLIGRLEDNTNKFIATGGRGTQNCFRDNVVMLVFSEPVDFDSLDARTVKIGIPSGANLFIDAPGSFYRYVVKQFDPVSGGFVPKRTYYNRVIFDPTSRMEPLLNQNPYGFAENSLYTVSIPGTDSGSTKVVRGAEGQYNLRTFSTTFRTTDRFLQDYRQPSIVKIEGNDAPGVPLDGRTNVDSRADVIVFFSEPMLPSSFDPNSTLRVYNSGQSRYVSGTIRPSPDGMSFTFRPAFGYGRGPYNIQVTVSSSLRDRSSNALDKGAVVNFTTEYDPFAPNYNEIVEDFDSNTFEDTTYQNTYDKADWNKGKNAGQLAGVFGAKTLDITFTNSGGHGIPWWYAQSHTQNLYSASQLGNTARTISGFKWRYYQATAPVGATYAGTTVLMGHNTSGNLNTNFTGSYSDTPVTVFNGNYSVNTSEIEWISGPAFTANWAYNGRDNAVLDIATPNGSGGSVNYWRYTTSGQGGTTMIRAYSGGAASGMTWNHDVRFSYLVDKSEAQSKWYDTLQNSPVWLEAIVLQTMPPGTVIAITYQGGHESPLQPGTVDIASLSNWSTDPFADLGSFRYIRFHVDMTSNLGSSTKPIIDQIKLPFIYY